MTTPRYPSLYQINTRVWLTELSGKLGRPATPDDVPDAELDRLCRRLYAYRGAIHENLTFVLAGRLQARANELARLSQPTR